jgi:hypothetical protein
VYDKACLPPLNAKPLDAYLKQTHGIVMKHPESKEIDGNQKNTFVIGKQ